MPMGDGSGGTGREKDGQGLRLLSALPLIVGSRGEQSSEGLQKSADGDGARGECQTGSAEQTDRREV